MAPTETHSAARLLLIYNGFAGGSCMSLSGNWPVLTARAAGLLLLVAANLAVTILTPTLVRRTIPPDVLNLASLFLLLAQVVVFAVWLAWSDLFVLVRWASGVAVLGTFFLMGNHFAAWMSPGPPGEFYEITLSAAIVLLAAHAVLLPLRWLCGWRLTFRSAQQPPVRRGQFTLQHWFVWCACLVAPLALFAAFPGQSPAQGPIFLGILLVFVAPLLASALPAAFSRRWWLWSVVAIGWTSPIGLAIAEIYWQYSLTQGLGFAGRHMFLLIFWIGGPSAITAMLLVNLLALRALGLRWVGPPNATAIASSPPPVEVEPSRHVSAAATPAEP
jgi:hypothetical protein